MTKTNQSAYSYPDKDDKITSEFIEEKQTFKGQWEKSEKDVLGKIESYLKENAASRLLDAGCGTGRLLPQFQRYFESILAIDPDPAQIRKAKNFVKKQGFQGKVTFKITPIEMLDWSSEGVDSILCSHILQHVHTNSVKLILQKFKAVSKPNASLFILTTHAETKDFYVKDFLKNGKIHEAIISKAEFNSIIENKKGELPIHFFSRGTLQKGLQQAGFELLDYEPFHRVETIKPENAIGKNPSEPSARDALLVCKKLVGALNF